MRIVLWFGNEPNQQALAHKLHKQLGVSGIVVESRVAKRKYSIGKIFGKLFEKVFMRESGTAWRNMLHYYSGTFKEFPNVPITNVSDINSGEAFRFTSELTPDLVIVSGTGLIKKHLLSLQPSIGIINLHTGLSPYIKGGPNCTNWCIATGQFHMIGNTVMWIDEGIDSGNLLTTEFTEFNGTEDLNTVHIKVMDHAHDLVTRSAEAVARGLRQSIPQNSIAKGKTFYNREWGLSYLYRLQRNLPLFRKCFAESRYKAQRKEVTTVSLPS